MVEFVQKMVRDLRTRAVNEVPDEGEFKIVYEEFSNTDKGLDITMESIPGLARDIEDTAWEIERNRY